MTLKGIATLKLETAALDLCVKKGELSFGRSCVRNWCPNSAKGVNAGRGQILVRKLQIYRTTSCFPKQPILKTLHSQRLRAGRNLSLNWLSNSPGRLNPQTNTETQ